MKLTYLFLLLPFWVSAQSSFKRDNTALRSGNSAYEKQDYASAINEYQKALTINKNNEKAAFNLGDALYQDKKYAEATQQFDKVSAATQDKELKAKTSYNKGNAFLEQKQYEKAIEAYKNTLRMNPQDADARYNLSYALQKLKKEQQDQQENKDQQDKEKEDKEKQDQEKKDQEKQNQDSQNPENKPEKPEDKKQADEDKKEQKPEQEGQNAKMSEADAQRLLDALKSEEEKVRQRYQKTRSAGRPPLNSGKDW